MIPTFVEKDKWPENRLKGSMSECIVEQMFSEAGYKVFRFGYESAIQHLKELKLKDNDVTKMIRAAPDFIAVDKEGHTFFIEVKFRTNWRKWGADESRLKWIFDYWKNVILLIVSNETPYFKMATIKEYMRTRKLHSFEEFRIIKVNKNVTEKYEQLIKKYLNNKEGLKNF